MKARLAMFLLFVCAVAFALGIAELFRLRFQAGDVYPAYSTLRADPLGTMAIYESLGRLRSISVARDFSAINRLPDGKGTTYLHLAADTGDWDWLPEETWKELNLFLFNGGRLAITFYPETARPLGFARPRPLPPPGKPVTKKSPGGKGGPSGPPGGKPGRSRPGTGPPETEDSIQDRWGVQFDFMRLAAGTGGVYEPALVKNRTALALPASLEWHSAMVLTNLAEPWHTIYARGTNPVVAERRFGAGTVVLATDSYFLSNEALRKDRHADLLAWLVGPNRRIIFDEAHFGIMETSGVATLIRKYRLHGLAAGLLLLALLFIWKNSVSLVPPHAGEAPLPQVTGKDAAAGFVNLLRRNIPARDLLGVCFAEWTKFLGHASHYSIAAVDKAQAVMEAETAGTGGGRDPVKAYQDICRVLKASSRDLRMPAAEAPNPEIGNPTSKSAT